MERKYLITHEGNFYKANLHSHSTFSDGVLTPEQAKELYKSHGYSVYAYTDHVKLYDHRELTDPDFLVLVGYELGILRREPYWKTTTSSTITTPAGPPRRPATFCPWTASRPWRSTTTAARC